MRRRRGSRRAWVSVLVRMRPSNTSEIPGARGPPFVGWGPSRGGKNAPKGCQGGPKMAHEEDLGTCQSPERPPEGLNRLRYVRMGTVPCKRH
eukprot:6087935-Pyramimonas_sp.AAC.1